MASAIFTKAEQISPETAMQIAKRELATAASGRGMRAAKASETLTLAYTSKSVLNEEDNCFYVFNRSNGGFVIAGADDCASSVLAVVDEGSFNADSIPSAIAWWFEKCQEEISGAMMEGLSASDATAETDAAPRANVPAVTRSSVSPLLTTTWSQNAPYNQDCVFTNSNGTEYTAPGGCVPVALAQVMRYYEWPQTAITGDWTNTTSVYDEAVFDNLTFDWDNMPDALTSSSSEAEKAAVASLIRNCGKIVNAYYTSGCTSALEDYILSAAPRIFGYSKSVSYRTRFHYTDSEWEAIIINELLNKRPVIYAGGSSAYRHAFVVDGYDAESNLFHLNLGWGGIYNGYYSLSSLVVRGTGLYMNFNGGERGENIIINLRRPADDDKLDIPMVCNGNIDGVKYTNKYEGRRKTQLITSTKTQSYYFTKVTLSVSRFSSFGNYELDYMNPIHTCYMAVRATDIATGEVLFIESPQTDSHPAGSNYNNSYFGFIMGDSYLEKGHSYKVDLFYHMEDSEEWLPVVFAYNCSETAILTRNEDNTYSVTRAEELPNIEIVGMETGEAAVNGTLDVKATLCNTGDIDWFGKYTVTLLNADSVKVASRDFTLTIAAGATATLETQFSLSGLEAGDYSIQGKAALKDASDPYLVTVTSGVMTGIDGVSEDSAAVTLSDSHISVSADEAAIAVYNMAGQLVASADGNEMEISQLGAGVYVAKIVADGADIVKKFAK